MERGAQTLDETPGAKAAEPPTIDADCWEVAPKIAARLAAIAA